MHVSVLALLTTLLFTPTTTAQMIPSPPFALVLLSTNSTINSTTLQTCHEGAALESLCPTYLIYNPSCPNETTITHPQNFTFNTSVPLDTSITQSGLLIYTLRGTGFVLSSPLEFTYNPTTNVAVPEFTPSYGDSFAFDVEGKLGVQGYVDDTMDPIALDKLEIVYRWVLCETYVGYDYTTLAWVMGNGEPQNPTCQRVEVVRVFV